MHKCFTLQGKSFKNPSELMHFSATISQDLALFLSFWFDEKETLTVNTSGSTGTPKPIEIKKQFMKNSAKATGTFFDLGAETKALCCLSINYIAGKMMVVRALELGWNLEVVAPTSNPLKNTATNYDFCAMVPMQVKSSLKNLNNIKKLIIGGGVVSSDLKMALQQVNTLCFATYGMTETVTHIAVKKLNGGETNVLFYKVLPNVSISNDERNCLVIDAPLVSGEKIVTNDVVICHSDSEFEYLGRYDNVINSGGIKLHPEQIEKELSKIIGKRFFVAGLSDAILGERLVLLVEGNPFDIDFSLTKLSKYETPKAVYFVKKFIVTETKKIQRKKTLDLL